MFEPVRRTRARSTSPSPARADLMLIAPASATTIARLAHGLADDMLSLTVLATKAPVLVAPAMDSQMWEAAATQANVATLQRRGVSFVGPAAAASPAATSAPAGSRSPRRSSAP